MDTPATLETRLPLEVYKVDTLPCPFLPEDAEPLVSPCYGYDDEGYLATDGLPMAEHDTHRKNMNNAIESLQAYFASRAQEAYVSGNTFVHYQKEDRNRYVAPDCYVVFGAEQRNRLNYKSWKEGDRLPSVVIEFTSAKTQKMDAVEKRLLYERMISVQEYIQFDPYGDYLQPQMQGFTLAEGRYERMPYEPDGRLYSAELDLYLETQGEWLRFYDAKTGEYLRTPAEAEQERLEERERADLAEVRAEEEAAGRQAERLRAEAEKARADAEANAREAERQRAESAESELARLRAELEALRTSPPE